MVTEKGIAGVIGHVSLDWGKIVVATGNRRSRAIPERVGFHKEGTLRQFQLIDGRYLDCVSYSMLAADWLDVRPREIRR